MNIRITFDGSSRDFILDAFGKAVDKEGFIVEKTKPNQRVLTPQGEEIPVDEFAGVRGVRKGTPIFMKSDIVSLIEVADALANADLTLSSSPEVPCRR